jgi:serine/threonine protein kinase
MKDIPPSIGPITVEGSFPHPAAVYRVGSLLKLHTTKPSATDFTSICIRIVQHLSVSIRRPSQTVVARLMEGDVQYDNDGSTLPTESMFVAKFYDPEYALAGREWPEGSDEWCATSKGNEVKAYNLLRQLQGSDTPVFYGEYSYERPTNAHSERRRIAVLLLEYITDPALSDLTLTPGDSTALTSASFALLKRMHDCGVYHHDIRAPNMLWGREQPRLTLLDFEHASFGDSFSPELMAEKKVEWEKDDIALMSVTLEECGFEVDRPPQQVPDWFPVVPYIKN